MKKRILLMMIVILLGSFILCCNILYAATTDMDTLIGSETMKNVSKPDDTGGSEGIIGGINSIIGLLQFAGSGVSIIVVTILGMKYILASPADKADVKKSITPIIIGCILLFGGVNIVAAVMDFSNKVFPNS